MPAPAADDVAVAADELAELAAAVLRGRGVPGDDAALVADSLVTADLWGHQSHGVLRLSWYVSRLDAGTMAAATRPETVVDSGPVVVVDGHDGVGQVLAAHAVRTGIERAKQHGVAVVAVRNSNHFGTAAYFTRLATPEGCIAFLATNASPAMAPWGGREKAIGTNPWSIAAPGGSRGTVVMDIANTAVARGKLYLARQRGEEIPEGWALDAAGTPTTDPQVGIDGTILPMAGHKGYAIALMMDILAGVLSGSAFGTDVAGPYQAERRSGCGHLAIVLDAEAFLAPGEFGVRMDALLDEVTAVAPAAGFKRPLYPGEPEARSEERTRRDGLRLPQQTVDELQSLADAAGIEVPWSR